MAVHEVAPGDPRLLDYTDLTDVALRSKREASEGIFIGEGELVIRRALAAGYRLRSVLTSAKRLVTVEDVIGDAEVYLAAEEVMESVTGFHLHRGALAAFDRKPSVDALELLAGRSRIAILEDINSHTNVGAVFRNAAGLGIEAVLLSPSCADPLYRRAVRVSMGSVFAVAWGRFTEWPTDLDVVRGAGFDLAAFALGPGAVDIAAAELWSRDKVAVMLGAEGPGLTRGALDQADRVVQIPMAAEVDSLNVAAASAVAFYEACRRGGSGKNPLVRA